MELKRLLLPLLAALALPTAVNAEVINLECTAKYTEKKDRIDLEQADQYKIYIDIDTERQTSTIDDGDGFIKKFNTFVTRDVYLLTFLNTDKEKKESYDISRVNGSYIYKEKYLKYDKESAYFDENSYKLIQENLEKFGELLLTLKEGGYCKKAEKVKTLF